MTIEYDPVKMANEMMRCALVLLDEARETHAAIELQHAISILNRETIPQAPDATSDTPSRDPLPEQT